MKLLVVIGTVNFNGGAHVATWAMIGLLCGRWTLMARGEVDYGLMGLIGGKMVKYAAGR